MPEKVDDNKLKKEYPLFQKKYSLPSLESIENDFGMMESESDRFLLGVVRKRMGEKIDMFLGILSNIFEGDASLSSIYESKVLDDEKKAELFRLYKKLMKYSRHSSMLSLSYDEKSEAEFLKEFYKEWQGIKSELKKYLAMFRDSWDSDAESADEIQNYLG